MKHYIIFQRTNNHCVTWLVRASSLREAMAAHYLHDMAGAEHLDDGSIQTGDSYGGKIIYSHPLECIESEVKSLDGIGGHSWEMRELQDQHWEADFAEVFGSNDPADVEEYINACRPVFCKAFPKSRARAFVWYLKEGPLVTFHRRKEQRRRWPIQIMARYLLPWKDWEQVREWHGTHDDLLEQMIVEYPLPQSALASREEQNRTAFAPRVSPAEQ